MFGKQGRNAKFKTLTHVSVCDNQVKPYSDKEGDFVKCDRNEIKISWNKKGGVKNHDFKKRHKLKWSYHARIS